MTAQNVNAPNINDLGQYTGLRAAARANDPQALRAAARQFESLFTQQLLKTMRQAKIGDDVMGSEQTEFYQGMFDQQLSNQLSQGRGLGIADLLVRQLQQANMGKPAEAPAAKGASAGSAEIPFIPLTPAAPAIKPLVISALQPAPVAAHAKITHAPAPQSFLKSLLPHAVAAAHKLGIPVQTLMAQAALETGWGKHQIHNADGTPSYNFFGIKASKGWQGASVHKTTLEYEKGSPKSQVAAFRSYSSPQAALNDYVKFIQAHPRYADALRHGGDGNRYAEGLQKAGYATDPAYAEKIKKIAGGPLMTLAMASTARTLIT
jgi:flagellar protein FlgJ